MLLFIQALIILLVFIFALIPAIGHITTSPMHYWRDDYWYCFRRGVNRVILAGLILLLFGLLLWSFCGVLTWLSS